MMRSAVIKKANKDKQQNQTTITTNINYIQNFKSYFKKKTKLIILTKSKLKKTY